MVYVTNSIYVTIPNFSEIEEGMLKFIQNSILEPTEPLVKYFSPLKLKS